MGAPSSTRRWTPLVLGAVALLIVGYGAVRAVTDRPEHAPDMPAGKVEAAALSDRPLTVRALRSLPPLQEATEIKPTGNVREFTLTIERGKWELVKGTTVDAITVNGTVPGPTIRVTEGDTVRITVKNRLDEVTSIHWHGLHVPYDQDGVAPGNQLPIPPGGEYTYEFTANHAGTFMYHSHSLANEIEQIDRGLYGAFIIDPQNPRNEPRYDVDRTLMLSGWIVGMPDMDDAADMTMSYNYWTINGKSFPDTEPIRVKKGDRVRLRLINISNLAHPMHLHGHDFRIIAVDGHPLPQPQIVNTLDVEPGKTYEIDFIADNPGFWVFHCHELHHTMNGETAPGGLIQVIQYEGFQPVGLDQPAAPPAQGSTGAGVQPRSSDGMQNAPMPDMKGMDMGS